MPGDAASSQSRRVSNEAGWGLLLTQRSREPHAVAHRSPTSRDQPLGECRQGLITGTPVGSTSAVFRVTNVRP